MIKLTVTSGPLKGSAFLLPPGLPVEIGRSDQCFVRLSGHGVSRRHAILSPAGDTYVLRDNKSRNGILVNGERVTERKLEPGDVIRVGEFELGCAFEDDDPRIGKEIAGYRVEKRIGKGGMGVVYLAHQMAMDRPVALKILSRELSENREFVGRFIEEARFMAKVSHPHVVQVHNVGEEEGVSYLSMEYMEGGSLKGLLEREGPLPPIRALPMILDACRALIWAGEQGIVHRDIKPGNLLMDSAGKVKVGDFGVAADLTKSTGPGKGHRVVGSPHFMAPEQALGRVVDQRADIYALGCTLLNALTAKTPFKAETSKGIFLAKMRVELPPLSHGIHGVPPALESVLRKMVAPKVEDRYPAAADVLRELGKILESLRPAAPRLAARAGSGGRAPSRDRGGRREPARSRTKLVAFASIIILSLIGAAVLLMPGRPAPEAPGTASPRDPTSKGVSVPGDASTAGADSTAPPLSQEVPLTQQVAPSRKVPGEPMPPLPAKGQEEERTGEKAAPAPAPPPPAAKDAVSADLEEEVELAILEGDFARAVKLLRGAGGGKPELAAKLLRRVQMAESLHKARVEALSLERAGKPAEARKVLLDVIPKLEGSLQEEARLAAESLGPAEKEGGGEEPPSDAPSGSR
jgi:serine/threonine protein kinase